MAGVTYEHVWKKFGDFVAINDLNIKIEDKEFLDMVHKPISETIGAFRSQRQLSRGRQYQDHRRADPEDGSANAQI